MRPTTAAALATLVLATTTVADEVYRSVDHRGVVTYSNVPMPGSSRTGIRSPAPEPPTTPAAGATTGGGGAPAEPRRPRPDPDDWMTDAPDVEGATSAQAAPAPEEPATPPSPKERRELRAVEQRLREIDERLDTLARARTSRAKGDASTGGVGTNAANVLSPEEEALQEERSSLESRATELRGGGR